MYYKLIDKQPVLIRSESPNAVQEFSRWLEQSDKERLIDLTYVGRFIVSTVFLGIDHNFMNTRDPVLFETMVFDRDEGGDIARCCTYEEAQQQHKDMVAKVRRQVLS